jgi:hypothetical protein
MIDWLTKQISKFESVNNNKRLRNLKKKENWEEKIRMITSERMKEFIILMIISTEGDCA